MTKSGGLFFSYCIYRTAAFGGRVVGDADPYVFLIRSDFRIFRRKITWCRLAATDFAVQNLRATNGRPYGCGEGRWMGAFVLVGRSSGLGTGRRGRRPLQVRILYHVRIPYAERKPATGRAVSLEYQCAASTSHEFVSGDTPPVISGGTELWVCRRFRSRWRWSGCRCR